MTHYIYKTTNIVNKKYYIGVHTTKSGLVSNYTGTTKTEEHRAKIGKGISDYAKENPEHRAEWQAKINKNSEKIAKTAETHRGMKRSDESKERMSAAAKGGLPTAATGKMVINNGVENKMIPKTEPIPDGWVKGLLRGNKK